MEIVDLTNFINEPHLQHNFKFNPSIQYICKDIVMMTFRNIYYNIHDNNQYQPFQVWWDPKILQRKSTINDKQLEQILSNKYKEDLQTQSKAFIFNNINQQYYDLFDGTGLVIFKLQIEHQTIQLIPIYILNDIFGGEFNQDTRLFCKFQNIEYEDTTKSFEFTLTYNIFKPDNSIQMIRRLCNVNLQTHQLQLQQEQPLLFYEQQIEKNCIIFDDQHILYSINGQFKIQDILNNIIINKPIQQIQSIIDYYGSEIIMFSLGTQVIKYGQFFISCGHLKIQQRDLIHQNTNFAKFINGQTTKFRDINKYVYFMFFFVFDSDFNIVSLSNAFLPTSIDNQHYPYLLCFPTGLTDQGNNIIVSYGEADIKSKLLILTKQQIGDLLQNIEDITPQSFKFQFLISPYFQLTSHKQIYNHKNQSILNQLQQYNPNFKQFDSVFEVWNRHKKQIIHYGYFNSYNCGDDAFVDCFQFLNKVYYPQLDVKYTSNIQQELSKNNLIILGGGDVVNGYFVDDIQKYNQKAFENKLEYKPKHSIAISVGTPYKSLFHYIQNFTTIFTRNLDDVSSLQQQYNTYIQYFPDLVFMFDKVMQQHKIDGFIPQFTKQITTKQCVGISIPQTYISNNYIQQAGVVLNQLSDFIIYLLKKNYIVYLIPFCINQNNNQENDQIINLLLLEQTIQKLGQKQLCDFVQNIYLFQFQEQQDSIFHQSLQIQNIQNRENIIHLTRSQLYTIEISSIIQQMDIMICGRFHAHIFSILFNIPFISITTTRKCEVLMRQYDIHNYLQQFDVNEIGIPINLNTFKLTNKFEQLQLNYKQIKIKLSHILQEIQTDLGSFIEQYVDILLKNQCREILY